MGLIQSQHKINEGVCVFTTCCDKSSSMFKTITSSSSSTDTNTNKGKIKGTVIFKQKDEHVKIIIDLKGLKKNHLHGFHIHETGDLREDCKSCCSHYNPYGTTHGCLHDEESHAGDLGNIRGDDTGSCNISITTDKFTVSEIVGRSLIIHEDEDDLGKGSHDDSKTTGHSGTRITCAIIGIVKTEKCS